jgi:two-component system chemotaxis response regulator CheY
MKILIVDDDPVSRRILKEIITQDPGHQTTEAADGSEAWALLDDLARYFNAVFLDVSMPKSDGLDVLSRIRSSTLHRNLHVVMCTATSDRETVQAAIKLGARHFIVKPATAAFVQKKLHELQAKLDAELAPRPKSPGLVTA